MRPGRALAHLVLAVTALPSPAVPNEVVLPKPGQKWIEVRTENFRFISNAGKGATRRVAVDLEELRAVLAELTDYELQSPIPWLARTQTTSRSTRIPGTPRA